MEPSSDSIGTFYQAYLLFKKNLLIKKRQDIKKLCGEILLPALYLVILCYLVKLEKITTYESIKTPYQVPQNVLKSIYDFSQLNLDSSIRIDIVPNSEPAKKFTSQMDLIWKRYTNRFKSLNRKFHTNFNKLDHKNKNIEQSSLFPELVFRYHNTEEELIHSFKDENATISCAVLLNNVENEKTYTVRMSSDGIFNLPPFSSVKTDLKTCRGALDLPEGQMMENLESPTTCPVNSYYYTNFLAIEQLVNEAQIEIVSGKEVDLSITMENYPTSKFIAGLSTFLRILIPLYTVIPLSQLINNLLILIVTEKESKIKDGLRIVGVSDSAYWMGWFGVYSLIVLTYAVMFTSVIYFMNVLKNFNPFLLFLIFLLFGFSVITFAFALTPFFHKPKTAGIIGTLIMQFTSMIFLVQTFLTSSNNVLLQVLKLFSSLAFTTAIDEACKYEYSGGMGFNDLYPGGRGEAILYSLIFLIFDTVFYALIALYLDNVIPNEFGVRKDLLFFLSSIKSSSKKSFLNPDYDNSECGNGEANENIEAVPNSVSEREAIRIRNIRKTYGNSWLSSEKSVEAVRGISMSIYEGQITAILGKNGAGKSTLFNILTGLITPSSGSCHVFGNNISDHAEVQKLHKITGLCLQYDLHFSALTVKEHLEFYGKLRGLNGQRLREEVDSIVQELKLEDRFNIRANKLSGGQKRKLSVGIALIGDPKIILLDEPTASMDPLSRRHLWTLLQKRKQNKVILLTTHFMDEADILADRKAIIHEGELKCLGSSLFLKNRYGIGYYLTIELKDRYCDTEVCDELIYKTIPSALGSKKIIANEVKYSLPHSEISNFPTLFEDLESVAKKSRSEIKSYGVSMTTLEEVFLKISTNAESIQTKSEIERSNDEFSLSSGRESEEQNLIQDSLLPRPNSFSILLSMCHLRILRLVRNPFSCFFMIFMPLLFIGGGLGIFKAQSAKGLDETMNFSQIKNIYKADELNIALHDSNSSLSPLKDILERNSFKVFEFDGEFSSLLDINQPIGTIAGIVHHTSRKENEIEKLGKKLNKMSVHLMINGTFLHTPPFLISIISQYYNENFLNNISSPLEVLSKPFPSESPKGFDPIAFYAVFLLGPAFIFISIGMVIEIVKDTEICAKNHLRLNGLSFFSYYIPIFIVFGILSLLVTIAQLSFIWIFNLEAFKNVYAFTVITVLLMIFIPVSLLFSAVFSYFFQRMETAQTIYSQFASWSGSIVSFVIIIMDSVNVSWSTLMITHAVFCSLDIFYIPFSVFYFVNKVYLFCSLTESCSSLGWSSYFGTEFIIILCAMLAQIPFYALLLHVVDTLRDGGLLKDIVSSIMRIKISESPSVSILEPQSHLNRFGVGPDEDVSRETERVQAAITNDTNLTTPPVLVAANILKSYPSKSTDLKDEKVKNISKRVLNSVSFLVEEGEVFGLLGHNGAGKTTLMKIITAEEKPEGGVIKLCGEYVSSNKSSAFLKLGYCPQNDVLWDNITLEEHLKIYSTIRGIPKIKQKRVIEHLLNGLQIKEHRHKRASALSGGTRRKLSYSLSMLGAPKAVFLDEPSTGMDPQSKRFLWNTILGSFKDSRGAILTTHSMEEADVLCSRIAIMVKGTIICIGSPQHIKSKYGNGYTLDLKLPYSESSALERIKPYDDRIVSRNSISREPNFAFTSVKEHFPQSRITESFGNRAVFSVPAKTVNSISQTFRLLQSMKKKGEIEEYSFSQTTLEQVFLSFAKEEEENADAIESEPHSPNEV